MIFKIASRPLLLKIAIAGFLVAGLRGETPYYCLFFLENRNYCLGRLSRLFSPPIVYRKDIE